MNNVFAAETAVFLKLQPFGILLFVFRAAVVDSMALGAFELNIFSHLFSIYSTSHKEQKR